MGVKNRVVKGKDEEERRVNVGYSFVDVQGARLPQTTGERARPREVQGIPGQSI